MTGLVRKATLLSACGLMLAGAAMAGIPSAANSTLGNILISDFPTAVVGPNLSGDGIAVFTFQSCIKDALDNPVAFASVTVDFSGCAGDVQIGLNQEDPAVTVGCAGQTITKEAGSDGCIELGPFIGRTNVNIPGWPDAPGNSPVRNIGPSAPIVCGKVYAGGVLLGTVGVMINRFDSDLDLDVDAGDGGFHLDAIGQFFGGPPPTPPYRIFYDFDYDEDVDAGDGGLLLDAIGAYFGGVSVPYPGPYCP